MPIKKHFTLFLIAIGVLCFACVLSLALGPVKFSLKEIIFALFHPHDQTSASIIIWQLRLPRMFLGMLVGAGLAVCGATLQALLRNPLAEPYTLGISSAGALGITIASAFNLTGVFVPLSAFLGCIASVILIYAVASLKRFSNPTLILAGIVLNAFFSSMVLLLFSVLRSDKMQSTIIWLMGDLSLVSPLMLKLGAGFIIPGIIALILLGRDINILTLGEQKAMHLGVDVKFIKGLLFVLASLITGACVAVSGIIGFIGLIIPHLARRFFGADARVSIPASAIIAGAFLVLCDTVSRIIILPLELPVGVITGICGGIFFLLLLIRTKKWELF